MMNGLCMTLTVLLACGPALNAAAALQPPAPEPPPAAKSPEPREQARDVSGELDKIIEKHKIPGMVALAIEGRRVIVQGEAGVRVRGHPEKITINDKMHLGSCTKAMTATLCAKLVERGDLRWDINLAEAFPRNEPPVPEVWQKVTLAQLLTNTGGVPGSLDKDGLWARLWKMHENGPEPRQALLDGVLGYQPIAKPGEKFEYSNGGFAIAGHIAETRMKEKYEELLRRDLLHPLGIRSGGFGPPAGKDDFTQPWGHTAEGKPVELGHGADNPTAITPAGRVHMSIGDWSKFVSLHLRGERGEPDTEKYLKPETFRKMHTSGTAPGSNYAMGWAIDRRPWAKGDQSGDTGRVFTHSGSNTMWFCVTWVAPEKNFAVLVCCNQGNGAAACDEACGALIKAWRDAAKATEKPNPKP
ncbi:MAG: serine hydrolase domain-containing protein [Phycisphaerales bacterium]